MIKQLTAVIQREGDGFVALCPELDIASQGDNVEEARDNLREALELFFEFAAQKEIERPTRRRRSVCYPRRGGDWVNCESFRDRGSARFLRGTDFIECVTAAATLLCAALSVG